MGELKSIRAGVFKSMRNAAGGETHEHREYSGTPRGAEACRRLASQVTWRMRKRTFPIAYFLKHLHNPLRGSTLIETMIASVIFLCVFAISLETISRLTVKKNDNTILVEVDYRIKQCRREFTTGGFEMGTYLREYPWGNITIILKPYRNYANLRELTITTDIKNNAKRLEYRYIFEPDNDV